MKEIGLFAFLIIIWTAGQVFLKMGMNELAGQKVSLRFFLKAVGSWPVLSGFLLGIVGALLWLVVLSRLELGFSNLVVSLTLVCVSLASAIVFKEPMSTLKWLGAALIVAGVFLVSQGR
jgi:drug/metabolite transporter (DMT)-like permease